MTERKFTKREFLKYVATFGAGAVIGYLLPKNTTNIAPVSTELPRINTTPVPTLVDTKTPSPMTKLEWSVFTGLGPDISTVEVRLGKPDYVPTFVGWFDGGMILPEVRKYASDGKKIMVFWEAGTPGKDIKGDMEYSSQKILDGVHDNYLKNFAKDIENGPEVILFPFPEVNLGTAQTETINGNSDKFKAAYDHVASFCKGNRRVTMGLALNIQEDVNRYGNELNRYLASRVDLIGWDGFNVGPPQEKWTDFGDLFGNSLIEAKRWNLPVIISSVGCAPGPDRPKWWQDAFESMRNFEIRGVNIFAENKDKKGDYERDWSLDDATIEVLKKNLGYDGIKGS